ncbi:MAG: hypothetical protein V7K47_05695 [Nostoc sp.]
MGHYKGDRQVLLMMCRCLALGENAPYRRSVGLERSHFTPGRTQMLVA